jgi:hypothetical protein
LNGDGTGLYHGFVMETAMPGLLAMVHEVVGFLCSTQVGVGRGMAIALTVALIVLAAGQLRLGGGRESRPLI